MKPKLIRNWEELAQIPPSSTHYIDIDTGYSGFIKEVDTDKTFDYLSTHTFYGHQHKHSTSQLQKCGFNVEIDNWDKKETTKQGEAWK